MTERSYMISNLRDTTQRNTELSKILKPGRESKHIGEVGGRALFFPHLGTHPRSFEPPQPAAFDPLSQR